MAKTVKTLRKERAAIVVAAGKVRDRVHSHAVDCLTHYKEHGDTSQLSEMINEFKMSGIYRSALLQWVKGHAKVEVNVHKSNDADGIVLSKTKGFDHKDTDLRKADAKPFWMKDTDADVKEKVFNIYTLLGNALKKEKKAMDNPDQFDRIEATLPEAVRRQLETLVAQHTQQEGGEKVAAPKTKAMH